MNRLLSLPSPRYHKAKGERERLRVCVYVFVCVGERERERRHVPAAEALSSLITKKITGGPCVYISLFSLRYCI